MPSFQTMVLPWVLAHERMSHPWSAMTELNSWGTFLPRPYVTTEGAQEKLYLRFVH